MILAYCFMRSCLLLKGEVQQLSDSADTVGVKVVVFWRYLRLPGTPTLSFIESGTVIIIGVH